MQSTMTSIVKHATQIQIKRNSSKARRQRGYSWEDTLSKRFNATDGWSGFRLGSSSIYLPDILALNPYTKSAFVIEAKSGTTDRLTVPPHQIQRCIEWYNVIAPFKKRHIVLAFKFISKKRIGTGIYDGRKLHEYFLEWNTKMTPIECVCMYDGTTYGRQDNTRKTLKLEHANIPIRKQGI